MIIGQDNKNLFLQCSWHPTFIRYCFDFFKFDFSSANISFRLKIMHFHIFCHFLRFLAKNCHFSSWGVDGAESISKCIQLIWRILWYKIRIIFDFWKSEISFLCQFFRIYHHEFTWKMNIFSSNCDYYAVIYFINHNAKNFFVWSHWCSISTKVDEPPGIRITVYCFFETGRWQFRL